MEKRTSEKEKGPKETPDSANAVPVNPATPQSRTERETDLANLTNGAMAPLWREILRHIPERGIFDAHSHIGEDLDGRGMSAAGMRKRQDAAGVTRSIVFPLNDPAAAEDFSGPNDILWEAYGEFPEHFVPFFRLNPHNDYDREFERCVERGFVGLKLHPTSQNFDLDDKRAVRLFTMAAEADLPVIIHAGFGMGRIVEPLLPTVEANPDLRLLLGHAAFVEVLEAVKAFAPHPNVLFETSVARAAEVYTLLTNLDPSRVVFGSDIPYGDLPSTLYAVVASAKEAGLTEDELAMILSSNIRRWFP
ncbi:amidohydrolase family protein [Rubrobacter indicoceani]|uniref:amidohydrolase family protein n=1 Tax=Rubrobacter indicoceani TaxID=2051957 RepID=UPI000E5C45C8|nr:amidohydrolase family protein [Rubrobacter indicoceani]